MPLAGIVIFAAIAICAVLIKVLSQIIRISVKKKLCYAVAMDIEAFQKVEPKVLTLLGMSGVGKTTLALKFEQAGWTVLSADLIIGTILEPMLSRPVKIDDLSPVAEFLGMYDGHEKEEFRRRQRIYKTAEFEAMALIAGMIDDLDNHCVIDTSGSFCELADDALYEALGEKSLFVYLKSDAEMDKVLLSRGTANPKPLFYPSAFFDPAVEMYETLDPQPDFFEYIFPRLFQSRLPKYQALADAHGVTVDAHTVTQAKSADNVLQYIIK